MYDSESNLYYYRNRIYSPELGRFVSKDPKGYVDGMNLYAYVKNNPIRYLDPMGTSVRDSRSDDYDVVDYIENITMNGGNSSDNKNIENNNQRIGFDIGIISISSEIINKTNHQFGEDNFNVILLKTDSQNISLVKVNTSYKQASFAVSVGNIRSPNTDFQVDDNGANFRAGGGFHTFEASATMEFQINKNIKLTIGAQYTMGGYSAEVYGGFSTKGAGMGIKATTGIFGGGAFFNIDF